jgi:hypothetical protein
MLIRSSPKDDALGFVVPILPDLEGDLTYQLRNKKKEM